MNRNDDCRETLSSARGDARDSAMIRAHLVACNDCRTEVAAFRSMAAIARVAWPERSPIPGFAQSILAQARDFGPVWLTPARFAVSFGSVAVLVMLTATFTSPTSTPTPAARAQLDSSHSPRPVAVRVQRSPATRVLYVGTGATGNDRRELDLDSRYRVDAVPANAIVLNTF